MNEPSLNDPVAEMEDRLRSHQVDVPPSARARVWAQFERTRVPKRPIGGWVVCGVGVVATSLLIAVVHPFSTAPEVQWKSGAPMTAGTWVHTEAHQELRLPKALVHIEMPSEVKWTKGVKQPRLHLSRGRIRLNVAPHAPDEHLEIQTEHAGIRVIGTRFTVEAGVNGTEVVVEEGIVELTPHGGASTLLHAGERARAEPGASSAKRLAYAEANIETLVVQANQLRQAGQLEDAARLYDRLADEAEDDLYVELALFHRAQIAQHQGRPKVALKVLKRAEKRVPRGPMALERVVMAAAILAESKDFAAAAAVIERAPQNGYSQPLERLRYEVARNLGRTDPQRALSLLTPLTTSDDDALRTAVEALQTALKATLKKDKSP